MIVEDRPIPLSVECGHQQRSKHPKAHSIDYQLRFAAKHGRPPTWEDSMAHCCPEIQEAYRLLLERGWKQNPQSEPEMRRF